MYLVGIGASTGGLSAITSLVQNIEAINKPVAYVIIQHLAPDKKSYMLDILTDKVICPLHIIESGSLEEIQNRLKKIIRHLDTLESYINQDVSLLSAKTGELVALVYISQSNIDEAELAKECADLAAHAQSHNSLAGISGFLIYSSGYFIQYLEGGAREIDYLYNRIVFDPRHRELRLLFHDRIMEKLFPRWSMEYAINTTEEDVVINNFIQEKVLRGSKMLKLEDITFMIDFLKNHNLFPK